MDHQDVARQLCDCCVWQVSPERLLALNSRLRGIRLGDFEYVAEALHLGAASGNRFQVPAWYLHKAHCLARRLGLVPPQAALARRCE